MEGGRQMAAVPEHRMVSKVARVLDQVVTVFLFLFVLLQPLSIAGAFLAYSGAALFWLARLALVRRGVLQHSPLDLPILIYWLLCAVSTLLGPLPASNWEGMRKVGMVFLVIVVAHNVPSLRRARQLVGVLFLAALVSVAYAGWEYAAGIGLRVHDPQPGSVFFRSGLRDADAILRVDGHLIRTPRGFLRYLNSRPPGEPLRLRVVHGGGIAVLKDAVPVVLPAASLPRPGSLNDLGMQLATARPARARGFYSIYISYAMVLEMLACLALGLWLGLRERSFSATSLGLLGLCLVFAVALGATLTRSAWMAFVIGGLLEVWLHYRNRLLRLALPVLLVLAAVGTNAAMHRWRGVGLIDRRDPGTEYRVLMWRDGLRLMSEHPWSGVGMNTIRDSWWKFNLAAYKKFPLRSHFHSTPIQIGVELGLPVLISWLVLMGCYLLLLLRLVKRARARQDRFVYGLALGILGATCAFLASSLVQYNFGDSVVVFQFWFLAGLALALWKLQVKSGSRASSEQDLASPALTG